VPQKTHSLVSCKSQFVSIFFYIKFDILICFAIDTLKKLFKRKMLSLTGSTESNKWWKNWKKRFDVLIVSITNVSGLLQLGVVHVVFVNFFPHQFFTITFKCNKQTWLFPFHYSNQLLHKSLIINPCYILLILLKFLYIFHAFVVLCK